MIESTIKALQFFSNYCALQVLCLLMLRAAHITSAALLEGVSVQQAIELVSSFVYLYWILILVLGIAIAVSSMAEYFLKAVLRPKQRSVHSQIAKGLFKTQKELIEGHRRIKESQRNKRYYEQLSESDESSVSAIGGRLGKNNNRQFKPNWYQSLRLKKDKQMNNNIKVLKTPKLISDISDEETYDISTKRQDGGYKRDSRISFLDDEIKWIAKTVYNIDYNIDPIEKIIAFENQSSSP